ncbi:unconventional myosin-XV [Chironomus tepperi]|uniref:unconventional myosin-XV n=1 Tax=Chironomus tepperi TaxID=113505 RepID=UPI00391F1501
MDESASSSSPSPPQPTINLQQGDLVWFDAGFNFPLPGEIVEVHRAAQIVIVSTVIDGKPQTFTLTMSDGNFMTRQDLGKNGVEDLTQITDLHEASLLWNLRLRYDNLYSNGIYTYCGSILIAVNPYKMYPDLYGLEMAKKYAGMPLGALPPHLFAIGEAAHSALPSPQVVVISGESGSGKTESTKLVMQYLAAVASGGVSSASALITEQILEANPILEAFGNAITLKNDNSSRFGKYLEIYFKSGAIIGAKITQYLLEKSRIVTQAQGERNYHVFYELLGGLTESERSKYGLLEADKYFYLNQGNSDCSPSGRIDWNSLQGAMQVLGLSENEREGIVRVLAAVLHLGNIYFHRRQLKHGSEAVELGSTAEVKWAAHLLQVPSDGLMRSLTSRITETRSEILHTPLSIDQALDTRDAFAKALYSGLFNWLVLRINSIIHKGGTHDAHRISILDIFGFESMVENSFEQLCINYANESLHLYFNKHIFKLEQAEYAKERLEWTQLGWEDNLPVIHLLAKKPHGIFHILDDESNFPRATDNSFIEKCHYNHALNELYSRPRIGGQEFGVNHYAGQVWYTVEGFLEKNRDALRHDVLELLTTSNEPLIEELTKHLKAQRDHGKSLPRGSNGRFVTMKPRTPTVSARFSDQLQTLMATMAKCNPWFVRCIKPNNDKQALRMDMPCVLNQLRYLGMLDTVRIRQNGYPVRLKFQHFVDRYRHAMKKPIPRGIPYRDICRLILESIPNTEDDYQIGATRVFVRERLHRLLENNRADRLKNAAVVIQRNVRNLLNKRKSVRQQHSAIVIQRNWRRFRDQKRYDDLKRGVTKAQALFRGHKERKRYEKIKNELKRRREVERVQKERAVQRIQKEQMHERNQIVHLDVPAELAFIFSKIDGWTPIHGDRHLVKVLGTIPGPMKTADLPNDLDQFAFGKFSSVYCNGIQLQPRKDPISAPFLSRAATKDQDFQDAISIFKLILRWTGDSTLDGNKDKALADYIIHKGLSSKNLRDEILVQLCNQAYHTDEHHANRIWHLMSHCLSSFQPGAAFSKYLMKFINDNAPPPLREAMLKKLLRTNSQAPARNYPPTWLEWRASSRQSDIALGLVFPDNSLQTVAIDQWTTCEEAAGLSLAMLTNGQTQGWSIVMEDNGIVSDTCGLDYVLDLIGEKELLPAFPAIKNDLFKNKKQNGIPLPVRQNSEIEPSSPVKKRPQNKPPDPPFQRNSTNDLLVSTDQIVTRSQPDKIEREEIHAIYAQRPEQITPNRKNSMDLLSRSSALNERYFEIEKSRSRSLDNLINDDNEAPPVPEVVVEPLNDIGLSRESRLNDRYHSVERLAPLKQPTPRHLKPPSLKARPMDPYGKFIERNEMLIRSSAMSDTSEAPSLASHVRRLRVPSQASDVDQFLDDLFSPVLDTQLDELSDARSLAASIRGGDMNDYRIYSEAPLILNDDINALENANLLCRVIKGGGDDDLVPDESLDEYITDLFQPIFLNENVRNLAEKEELVDAIKGGSEDSSYQTQVQRAFLESAMQQNIQIQQQLMAQNQALQTLLLQQNETTTTTVNQGSSKIVTKTTTSSAAVVTARKNSNDSSFSVPPPPPPMPPENLWADPLEARPFLDPYGRAKTVRIGKWRWPPPAGDQTDSAEDFISFKIRQNQRKMTPQSMSTSADAIEWEEFDLSASSSNVEKSKERFKSEPQLNKTSISTPVSRVQKRSFDIGAERPSPGSVGKLKLSTEMRQRLEQVTAGHSVRSTNSNKSEMPAPVKLDEARRMMLEQQLGGVRNQVQKMESSKIQKPFMPPPSIPAPPPPIRPNPSAKEKIPSFVQRHERDTFGVKEFDDSWGRAEAAKLEAMYDPNRRSRSHSRERENFSESVWDRTEVEGPPSNDEQFRSNFRDKNRQSEMTQIQRERESNMVYQPKVDKKTSAAALSLEKATFKSHMFSQKAQEKDRKTSASAVPSSNFMNNKEKQNGFNNNSANDDMDMIIDDFAQPSIPKPIHAPMLKSPASCLTYNNRVGWKLRVKKEVFRPNETVGPPDILDLLFAQIVTDINGPCLRITQKEKRQALSLLSSHGVNLENLKGQVRNIVKRQLVDMARTWPLYFSRLFIVNGSPQFPDVSILAVHQSGIFLGRKENDSLVVLKPILFTDLQNAITLPRPQALQLNLRNGNRYALHASRAQAIQNMIQSFLQEFKLTQSKASLKVTPNIAATTEKLEASLNQVNGHHDKSIEKNLIQNNHNLKDDEIIDNNEFIMMTASTTTAPTTVQQQNGHHKLSHNNSSNSSGNNQTHEATVHQDESSQTSITKHSLLQFAMQHFRNDSQEESPKSRSEKSQSADRRTHTADLVKWQSYPLTHPLLKLPPELTPLAIECFECILRYCGDMAQDHEFTEVKCVYTVLMHCHKHLILRDEVYCQLMKQTTANRSTCSDSSQRAWRLLSILAAYFGCTESLKAYLVEHLTSAASDRRKSSHGTAQVCLTNLRKTHKYGGRKNVPSVEEVTAVSAGRSARRQIYRLPGGAERIVNTRCSTVVADVITELCALLGIESEAEQQEFSLYCIVQGDAFTMPLSFDDYILDVTTELLKSGQPFYLIFCRSVWHFPLKRDPAPTPLYIEVLFNQVAPDYLEGLLLEIPNIGAPTPDYVRDMARIATILHRAADLNHIPVMKEIKFLLPKPALSLREIKPAQWVNLVQSIWGSVAPLSPLQCKAQFLSVLSAWPLFGSSFFAVKRVYGDDIMLPEESSAPMWRELILALNRRGVFFLDSNTHETLHHWHFIEIISTRKVRSEDGLLFLDMKVGNLLQQNVVRVQTEQAHEISRIMRQYITMAQSTQRDKRE